MPDRVLLPQAGKVQETVKNAGARSRHGSGHFLGTCMSLDPAQKKGVSRP
jgi:hypothetical protein